MKIVNAPSIAKKGRDGDTILAHINSQEAEVLKRMGGSGTINPHTRLREYKWGLLARAQNTLADLGIGGGTEGGSANTGSLWTGLRDNLETAAVLAGNYFLPGSALVTSNLTSKGSQEQLNSSLGKLAQLGTGGAGAYNGMSLGDLFGSGSNMAPVVDAGTQLPNTVAMSGPGAYESSGMVLNPSTAGGMAGAASNTASLMSGASNVTPNTISSGSNIVSDYGPPSVNPNGMNNVMGFQGGMNVAGSPYGQFDLSATDSSLGAAGNANQMSYAPGYEAATPYLNNMSDVNALEGAGVSGNLTGAGAYSPSFLERMGSTASGLASKAWNNPGTTLSAANLGFNALSSMYDYKAKKNIAAAQEQRYNDVNNQINNMYAPGSPEYNLMEQAMARKDAAAGRNSQYGARAVDLAARIAAIKAQNLASTLGPQAALQNNYLNNQWGGLNSLFYNYGVRNPNVNPAPARTS